MNPLLVLQTLSVWMLSDGGALTATAVAGLGVLLLAWALRALPSSAAARTAPRPQGGGRATRPALVRQCDPGAPGRSLPRAPSAGPAPA
ncbi:DUF6412 domain-containing protein [Planomonospora corallina]|uniref:DUF6412 domain-containing protein n=1 Tax=Planomonospora corallina TaxID=1806052 RepID=A0ABV8IFG9_9ACTN